MLGVEIFHDDYLYKCPIPSVLCNSRKGKQQKILCNANVDLTDVSYKSHPFVDFISWVIVNNQNNQISGPHFFGRSDPLTDNCYIWTRTKYEVLVFSLSLFLTRRIRITEKGKTVCGHPYPTYQISNKTQRNPYEAYIMKIHCASLNYYYCLLAVSKRLIYKSNSNNTNAWNDG